MRDKVLTDVLTTVAKKHGLYLADVENMYLSPYRLIKSSIVDLDIHSKSTEEIQNAKKNFTMPGFFKMYVDMNKLVKIREGILKYEKERG